jgi:pyruvate/2-oxoglutarate dehydrogenase complex dihydrolipoamide dehydrogenase (E3) component
MEKYQGCTYANSEIASVGLTEKQEKKDTNKLVNFVHPKAKTSTQMVL